MNLLRRILQVSACILLGIYVTLIFALDQPRVQTFLADVAKEQLCQFLGSSIEIERIEIGLFNAVELHNVTLYDKAGQKLLQSGLIYGKVRISSILKGKIDLRNISILDAHIKLYKETKDGDLNMKFIIDAFKSDSPTKKPLDLTINSLLLRRCQLAYDEEFIPHPTDNRFSPHHLFLHNVNANISLKHLTEDHIALRIRQLCFSEQSGFQLDNLRLRLEADRKQAVVSNLYLKLPQTTIEQQRIQLDYDFKDVAHFKKTLAISCDLEHLRISTRDLAAFAPKLKDINEKLDITTRLSYQHAALSLRGLNVNNATEDLSLAADLDLRNGDKLSVSSSVRKLHVGQRLLRTVFNDVLQKPIPQQLQAVGDVDFQGMIQMTQDKFLHGLYAYAVQTKGEFTTALGHLNTTFSMNDSRLHLSVASSAFNPSALYEYKFMPALMDFTATVNTSLGITSATGKSSPYIAISHADADILLNTVTINSQIYRNIHTKASYTAPHLQLHLTTDDPSARLQAQISTTVDALHPFGALPQNTTFNLNVDHFCPVAAHLTDNFGEGVFSAQAVGEVQSLDLEHPQAVIHLTNLHLSGDNGNAIPYHLNQVYLQLQPISSGTHVKLRSDFADLDYSGPVSPHKLKNIVANIYRNVKEGVFNESLSASNLTIDDEPNNASSTQNRLNFILAFRNADFFNRLLGTKINYQGTIQAQGSATEDGNHLTLACTAPTLSFGKFTLNDLSLFVRNEEGSFNVLGKGRKALKQGDIRVELTSINNDGRIYTDIEWDETHRHAFYGKLSAVSTLELPEHSALGISTRSDACLGQEHPELEESFNSTSEASNTTLGIFTEFIPSQVCIGDTLWQFSKSSIDYRNKRVKIDGFGIHNATQSLTINGIYDRSFEDAIRVDLRNLDLDYILAFARLNVVEFSGHATGQIFVRALPDGSPWAKAVINVPDMLFNHAKFGNADIVLGWDHPNKDITIEGHIVEEGIGHTNVWGYVDPVNKDLDLQTESKNTQLAFLNKYTADIFHNVSGRATGHCRIFGGFQTIGFSGHEVGEVEATVPVTGVTYSVKNADIDIVPNAFILKSGNIHDKFGGNGTAYGTLTHKYVKDMAYDFHLEGNGLRLYDKPRELDMPFFATATGSGNVHIHGKPGVMNAEMRISTTAGSELTYLLDSPDADVSQLLTFHDVTPCDDDSLTTLLPIFSEDTTAHQPSSAQTVNTEPTSTSSTDINLYFEVDVDNNSCLHLITDDKSGDAITTYGSGPIQANYHNKSGFQMFGTYNIDRGTYNLNIPTLAQRRKFDILSGGRVTFSGDPAQAEVKVKAQYVVNSASLADLNIGTGFGNNTTRVNCLVDIYGEVANMQFDLGIELPNCSEDEQQMVNQLIASDEDRTMQVLYLLGVGRFYAYNYTANEIGQSQSILMMNSLLSSTLSSQLNSIISDAVGSSNWTIGTNISTGQMGWNDMEVEGLVSSRLLNNRLLINGNFGYSDRRIATTNFVGDFDMQYLITPNGTVSVKAYSETNDRYFTKSTLTTQGVGLQLKKDFTRFGNLFRRKRTRPSNNLFEGSYD